MDIKLGVPSAGISWWMRMLNIPRRPSWRVGELSLAPWSNSCRNQQRALYQRHSHAVSQWCHQTSLCCIQTKKRKTASTRRSTMCSHLNCTSNQKKRFCFPSFSPHWSANILPYRLYHHIQTWMVFLSLAQQEMVQNLCKMMRKINKPSDLLKHGNDIHSK